MKPRPPAEWRATFLRALARGLSIARAAREADIDPSSVHRVRQRDPAFGAAWARAQQRGFARLRDGGEPALAPNEVVRASRDGRPRIQRAGPGRWSAGKERVFLEELAATANVTAAAAAARVSLTAIYNRKAQWPGFADRWRASLREGWDRIEAALIRAAADTLDPVPDAAGHAEGGADSGATTRDPVRDGPAMTIDQAIIVWKAHRAEVKGEPDTRRLKRRAEPSMEEVRAEVLRRVRAMGG